MKKCSFIYLQVKSNYVIFYVLFNGDYNTLFIYILQTPLSKATNITSLYSLNTSVFEHKFYFGCFFNHWNLFQYPIIPMFHICICK